MSLIVGMDVAKRTLDVAVPLVKPGHYRTRSRIAQDPDGFAQLLSWLTTHAPGAAVCMEATGTHHERVATFLVEQGITVYVVNPAQVSYYGKSELLRTKTDKADAKLIARFANHQAPESLRPWVPLTPVQARLRALFYRLDDLQQMQGMERNRLEQAHHSVTDSIEDVLEALEQQIAQLKKEIDDHIDSDPDLRRDRGLLKSIPGLGDKVSATFLACIGDLRRFDHPGRLDAFAGLHPAVRQSGESAGRARLSKIGHAVLRAKLYMAALVAQQHNPVIRQFVQRLRARGKPARVALVAAMRKLIHIAWGVVRSGRPFDPQFALA